MSKPLSILILLAAATMALPLTAARLIDREQPMDIRADHQKGGLGDDESMVLSGEVEILQGSLRISAAIATVERRGGEITRVILEGSPVRLQQQNIRGESVDASANRVVYTTDDEIMLLTGAAEVTKPRGTLRAESIRYNLDSGEIDSGGDGDRIHMTIQPAPREPSP